MASEISTGSLTLRAGTFQRVTHAEREGAVRKINISYCPVTKWTVIGSGDNKLDGRSFSANEQFTVSITETKLGDPLWAEDTFLPPNPEKIGTLDADSMRVHFYLQPDAFALFWNAAEATHGSTRSMELVLKPDRQSQHILTVTNIGLFEDMPGSPVHPVVAELRVMRERAKSIVVGFSVVLIASILLSIFRQF